MFQKQIGEKEEDGDSGGDRRVWDCGSPLYDSYELASISHLLERHMRVFLAPLPSSSSSASSRDHKSFTMILSSSSDKSASATLMSSLSRSTKGKGMWKKVAARRRMEKFGYVVHAMWDAIASRRKRVVPNNNNY